MSRSIRVGRPDPPPPKRLPLAYERVVSAWPHLALLVGMLVPVSAFAATRNWSLTRTPATVPDGAPASVQVTPRISGDDGGGEAVGCVVIAIPASGFTVTEIVTVDSVSDGDNWSASFSGDGTWWYASSSPIRAAETGCMHSSPSRQRITFIDTGSRRHVHVDGQRLQQGGLHRRLRHAEDGERHGRRGGGGQPAGRPAGRVRHRAGMLPLTAGAPGVLANDADPDGDPLTATQTSGPTNGSLVWGGDGSFTYTPDPGFVGSDGFTYHADAGAASSGDVSVSITVVNSAPLAVDDVYSIAWSQPLIVSAPGILGNDTDPDGDGLVASIVSGPSDGTLLPAANGSFTYVPNLLFVGTDSFTYTASDGVDAAQATVFINVANAAPVAAADGPYSVAEDTTLTVPAPGVLANDTDGDGDPLTAVLVADAANGAVTLQADGSFDYVPDPDFAGSDSFTYRASDGLDTSAVVSVSITVTAVNDPPVAAPDTLATAEDTTLVVPAPGVLGNDGDVDGDPLTAVDPHAGVER